MSSIFDFTFCAASAVNHLDCHLIQKFIITINLCGHYVPCYQYTWLLIRYNGMDQNTPRTEKLYMKASQTLKSHSINLTSHFFPYPIPLYSWLLPILHAPVQTIWSPLSTNTMINSHLSKMFIMLAHLTFLHLLNTILAVSKATSWLSKTQMKSPPNFCYAVSLKLIIVTSSSSLTATLTLWTNFTKSFLKSKLLFLPSPDPKRKIFLFFFGWLPHCDQKHLHYQESHSNPQKHGNSHILTETEDSSHAIKLSHVLFKVDIQSSWPLI